MGDSRQTFKISNEITGKTSKTNSSSQTAKNFNEFFASVRTEFASNSSTIDNMEPNQSVTHSIFVRDTCEGEVTEIIANLQYKNSSGIDEINNKLLKSFYADCITILISS